MLFKNITILDADLNTKENMYVGVKDEKIAYIGTEMPKESYGEEYDGKGKLLMPGFVNGHAHSPMTLMRGYGENMKLQSWLNDRIFPFEDHLDSNAVYWGTMLSMAESLRFGIVSSSDMYYFCPDMAKAYIEAGCKGNIARGIAAFKEEPLFESVRGRESKEFYESYNGASNGKIIVDMGIHAEYTSVPGMSAQLAEYAHSINANVHLHLSETKTEHEECISRHGKTPAQYFNDLGMFDGPAQVAHCVWVTDEDMEILKEKKVSVVANPLSNLKLASGVSNVPKMLDMGINVVLGTDSVASNNSLNFIEEMKMFALVPKMYFGDPTVITPKQALYAATRAGALAQGRLDCGKLEVGYRADLIVLDVSTVNMHPVHDMATNIVYSASGSDILLTMCDGKVLYENGEYKTIDIEKTIFENKKATEKILNALKTKGN